MFSRQHEKKDPVTNIRKWNVGDIPHIMRLVNQNPESGWKYGYDEWRNRILDDCYYGVVVEENYLMKGCATVFVTKSQRAYIHLFQVDIRHRKQGYGMHMMYHLFSKIREWNKVLCFDVRDADEDLQKFLVSPKIGFVPTEIHEFRNECGERDNAIYTMEYPPPWGYSKGTILVRRDGRETTKSFPPTPDHA